MAGRNTQPRHTERGLSWGVWRGGQQQSRLMSACVLPAAGVFGAGAEWDHGILSVHRLVLTVRLCIHPTRPAPQKAGHAIEYCDVARCRHSKRTV